MAATGFGNVGVPGASSLMTDQSLGSQVAGETEEQRRKRLAGLQANKMLPSTGVSAFNSFSADYGTAVGGS